MVPIWTSFSQHQLSHATSLCPLGSNCCSLAPLCCPLLASDHVLCSCHHIPQAPLSPPSLPRVRDWSTVVASCHHSLCVAPVCLGPRFMPTSLHVHPLYVVAPPCLVHARGNLSGGMMRATMPSVDMLAMAPGVTSVTLGPRGSGSFPPPAPAVSQHTSFLHFWLGSVTSLSRRAPRLACSLICEQHTSHVTFSRHLHALLMSHRHWLKFGVRSAHFTS